jgi:hypothetical protein
VSAQQEYDNIININMWHLKQSILRDCYVTKVAIKCVVSKHKSHIGSIDMIYE